MKKMFAMLLALLMIASCFAGCGASEDSDLAYVKKNGKLVVGITDFAPMDYKDEDGKWIGFDADMARIVA